MKKGYLFFKRKVHNCLGKHILKNKPAIQNPNNNKEETGKIKPLIKSPKGANLRSCI